MKINQLLSFLEYYIDLGFYHWVTTVFSFWWIFGIIGGWFFILSVFTKNKNRGLATLFFVIAVLTIIAQPILYIFLPEWSQALWQKTYALPIKHLYAYASGFVISGISAFFFYRKAASWFDGVKDKFHKTTSLKRDTNTDIRNLEDILPKQRAAYKVEKYFKQNQMFIGKSANKEPIFIPRDKWLSSHIDLVGTTGSGKGVAAGVMLTQAALLGEAVIVIDPKEDEYLPHVLGQAANDAQVPFYHIDLTGESGQWNPILNKSPMQIEEVLGAAFGLSEKGTDADFYRLNDRKAARLFSTTKTESNSFPEQAVQFFSENNEALENAPKFKDDLEEVASLPVVNINGGLDLDKAIKDGAVIYVRGSMRNPRILKLQRMFVLAVIQSCESRNREGARHVCIFLDEFKYLISRPTLEALGAIRDKHAHVILAHQSLGDLKDCPNDINPDSVVSSINENCSIKLTYKVNDPDTADWLARMSGKIQVDQESRRFDTNTALTELKTSERTLRQAERCLIDTNMLQSLPSGCAVLFGNGLADFVFTSPISVTKQSKWLQPTQFTSDSVEKHQDSSTPTNSKTFSEGLLDVD
ncbi:MAG: type IV secretory system conjugative DNA transfer family protein [Methylophaga sp.]|nr:type IV secretory system conjugative DNA transfer family protein [Methylophaga sp.]